jgi:endoglucanase
MDNSLVAQLNQAAIDAIRGAGATSQYIFVEGNSWTGAWTWVCLPTSSFPLPNNHQVHQLT